MHKVFRTDRASPDWHPTYDELQFYLDGELPAEEASRVRMHLEACWSCRVRSEKVQETIAAFIDYRSQMLEALPEEPKQLRTFRARLRATVEASGRRPLLIAWREFLTESFRTSRLRWAVVSGAVAAILAALLFMQLAKVRVASASELLSRSVEIRAAQIRAVPKPIVYQHLHVRRMVEAPSNLPLDDQSATVEIWANPLGAQVRVAGQGWSEVSGASSNRPTPSSSVAKPQSEAGRALLVWKGLEETYRVNRMDWRQPLSAASYEAWRGRLEDKYERVEPSVLPNGAQVLKLWTIARGAVPIGSIAEAGLVLQASDLHPIGGTLGVRQEEGYCNYDLAEMSFRVVTLEALRPDIFAEPALTALAEPVTVGAAPLTRALPSVSELAATEMQARIGLHRVAADLGEPIEIVRSRHEVEVRGLVDTDQRKRDLVVALQGIPHLVMRVLTVAETGQSLPASSPENVSEPRSQAAPGLTSVARAVSSPKLPIQEQLEKYLSEHRSTTVSPGGKGNGATEGTVQHDIQKLTSQAVTLSEASLEHAWALRRLAERYTPDEVSTLPPESRRQLEDLVRDHIRALVEQNRKYGAMVKPVLFSIAGKPEGSSPSSRGQAEADWPVFSPSLFNTVSQVDRLTSTLFAGAALPVEADSATPGAMGVRTKSPEACVRDLLAALSLLDTELPRLEKRVEGDFLSNR